MTDFFTDLERELDSAFAREGERSIWKRFRGVALPALRPVAAFAAVAVAAIAGVVWIGEAGIGEREVAAPDPRPAPAGGESGRCGPAISTAPAPREITERFAVFADPSGISDGDKERLERHPVADRVFVNAAHTVEVEGRRFVIVPGALREKDCDEGSEQPAVCLADFSSPTGSVGCGPPGGTEPDVGVYDHRSDAAWALVTDGVEAVEVKIDGNPRETEVVAVEDNFAYAPIEVPHGARVTINPATPRSGWTAYGPEAEDPRAEWPGGCRTTFSDEPAPADLRERLSVLERPSDVKPEERRRLRELRFGGISYVGAAQASGSGPQRHILLPMRDCDGRSVVCVAPATFERTSCGRLPPTGETLVLTDVGPQSRGRSVVAAVVTDGVRGVHVDNGEERQFVAARDNFAITEVPARGHDIEVTPAP